MKRFIKEIKTVYFVQNKFSGDTKGILSQKITKKSHNSNIILGFERLAGEI